MSFCKQPADELPWSTEKDGSRTCPHCGSLHPDDFLDIVWRFGRDEEGYHFSTTDKGWYKFYANRPGLVSALDGGIKFYGEHMPDDKMDEARTAIDFAIKRQQLNWENREASR